jgi:hypothetical protein
MERVGPCAVCRLFCSSGPADSEELKLKRVLSLSPADWRNNLLLFFLFFFFPHDIDTIIKDGKRETCAMESTADGSTVAMKPRTCSYYSIASDESPYFFPNLIIHIHELITGESHVLRMYLFYATACRSECAEMS